jgi:hypothetical protein
LRTAAPENVQLSPVPLFCVKSPELRGRNAFSSITRTRPGGAADGPHGSDGWVDAALDVLLQLSRGG